MDETPDSWVWARATVNLPGFSVGTVGYVDTDFEYVRECLEAEWLVPVEEEN